MEQKKTLWIIAAAGVFLLVVLATAGIMYFPAKNQEQAIRTTVSYSKNNQMIQAGLIIRKILLLRKKIL